MTDDMITLHEDFGNGICVHTEGGPIVYNGPPRAEIWVGDSTVLAPGYPALHLRQEQYTSEEATRAGHERLVAEVRAALEATP